MKRTLLATTALMGMSFAVAVPAYADFTPTEALDRYFDTAEALGTTVTVESKEESNGVVRWSGIVLTDAESVSTSTLDWLEASPVDDDTVKIVIGPKMTIETSEPGEDTPMLVFDVSLDGNQVIMSEEGDLLNASWTGDRMTMTSTSMDPDVPLNMNMTVSDLSAAYAFEGETYIEGSAASGQLDLSYGIVDEDMSFASENSIASTQMSFSSDIPQDENFEGFLDGSLNSTVTYTFDDMTSRTSFDDGEGASGWIASDVELSAGTFSVRDGAFALLGEAQGISYQGQPPMPGFPEMGASMASATMNMSMTFGKAQELAPMALAMTLEELVLDETIWGMFDPTGAISREPATLRLDLGAEALWMGESVEAALESGQPPFIPQNVALRELFLTLGGASLAATGEGMMSAQTGQPSGTAQIELKGILALIQSLSEIGLIPVPQAMMAQGMLPQFTRPGPDGDDHMISDIEAMPDGAIFVNGTRVK